METLHWIIGPQLIGVIFMVLGYIAKYFPPPKINHLYGYRTFSSMQSQHAWNVANHFAARYMIKIGLGLILLGLAVTITLGLLGLSVDTFMLITGILLIPSAIASCIMLIVATERHLEKTIDKDL